MIIENPDIFNLMDRHDQIKYWQTKLKVGIGDSPEKVKEALASFRETSKTCDRYMEKDLTQYCTMSKICKEEKEDDRSQNRVFDIGKKHGRSIGNLKVKPLRVTKKRSTLD